MEHDFADDLRGPEPRTRFLAYYLAIVAAVGLVLLAWWAA